MSSSSSLRSHPVLVSRRRRRGDRAPRLSRDEDPISLERFPSAFSVKASKQTYNARQLHKAWQRAGSPVVPHTRALASPAVQRRVARVMATPEARRWARRDAAQTPELTPVNWSSAGLPPARAELPDDLDALEPALMLFFRRVARVVSGASLRDGPGRRRDGPYEMRYSNGLLSLSKDGVGVVLSSHDDRPLAVELHGGLTSEGERLLRRVRDKVARSYDVNLRLV